MRDRLLIFAGLAVLVGLITFPFWQAAAARSTSSGPDLQLPTNAQNCVESTEYMRSSHMQLLNEWRDDVVRRQQRSYEGYDGQVYEISLTKTCLGQCHTDRTQFCDVCHSYAAVPTPYCWNCHQSEVASGGLQ